MSTALNSPDPGSAAADPREQNLMDHVRGQKQYYSNGSKLNKIYHQRMQTIILVLPAIITAMLAFAALMKDIAQVIIGLSAIASAIVVIAANLERQNGYGEKWLNYRMTGEALRQEETLFLSRGGRYRPDQTIDPIATFAERFVEICERETHAFNESEMRRQAEAIAQNDKALANIRKASGQGSDKP